MSDAVHDERTKLLATSLNNVTVAFVVIGCVTPLTALSFGVTSAPSLTIGTAAFALIWLCSGAGLHSIERDVVRSRKP